MLETFAGYVSEGMLPNVFPGRGEKPDYNTVDAALWFVEAWRAFCTRHDTRAAQTSSAAPFEECVLDTLRHGGLVR